MTKKISVIIPVYNAEDFLEYCMKSVLAQTHSNIEIILVDDGSTDSSGKLSDEYAKKDKRVIVIHQNNQGVANARNTGLNIATGAYIFFIDADDIIEKNCIQKLYEKAIQEDAALVMCDFDYIDDKFNVIQKKKNIYTKIFRTNHWENMSFRY